MRKTAQHLFVNREHAAQQLISKLINYRNKNCYIVAISNGGMAIAAHVAKQLKADLVFIPSEKLKHPGHSLESIGVVGIDYVVTEDFVRDIPQDYIHRQARSLRLELLTRYPDLYKPTCSEFEHATVIVVDDLIGSREEIIGCLKTIRKLDPKEIIVAAPVVTRGIAQRVAQDADKVVFIHVVTESEIDRSYLDFGIVTDEETRGLIKRNIKDLTECKQASLN